jgi:hypothetical protein
MKHALASALLLFAALSGVRAGETQEWDAITALDTGPGKTPTSRDEARLLAREQLDTQAKAIRDFLAKYPASTHAYDATIRLAGIEATIGMMDGDNRQIEDAMALLAGVERNPGAPADKRADAAFQRVCVYLQTLRGRERQMRDGILTAVRGFNEAYPGDIRGPRLLVEVATICDDDPALKRQLLSEANASTKEPGMKQRIADDLVRLDMLDKPLALKFQTIDGATFDMAAEKGNVVVIIFWSSESIPCLLWIHKFQSSLQTFGKAPPLHVVTVSLNQHLDELKKRMHQMHITWPTYYDGGGWQNAVSHPLGVNALPTVWIVDKQGVLRALDGKDDYATWIPKLLAE